MLPPSARPLAWRNSRQLQLIYNVPHYTHIHPPTADRTSVIILAFGSRLGALVSLITTRAIAAAAGGCASSTRGDLSQRPERQPPIIN